MREAASVAEARAAVGARAAGAASSSTCCLGDEDADELLDELRADGIPVVLVSGADDVERRTPAARPRCSASRSSRWPLVAVARRLTSRLTCAAVSVAAVRTPTEFEERLARLPVRALRGGARGARGREGGLRAGRDRPALRRPLQREQLEALREAEDRRRRATSASCSTGCARRARAGSSRPSSPSARTSSRTACSPSA